VDKYLGLYRDLFKETPYSPPGGQATCWRMSLVGDDGPLSSKVGGLVKAAGMLGF
jgi:hypothetical protein